MGQMMTEMVGMNIRGVLEGTWVKYEDQESNKGGTEEDRDEEKVPFPHRQKKACDKLIRVPVISYTPCNHSYQCLEALKHRFEVPTII